MNYNDVDDKKQASLHFMTLFYSTDILEIKL